MAVKSNCAWLPPSLTLVLVLLTILTGVSPDIAEICVPCTVYGTFEKEIGNVHVTK